MYTVLSRKKPNIKIKNLTYIFADISKAKDLKKKIKLIYDYIVNLISFFNHTNHKQTYLTHFIGLKNLINVT